MRSSFRAFACRASVHRIRCSGALESRGSEFWVGSRCGGRLSPSRHRTCFAPTDRSAPPERRPRLTREHKPDKDSRPRVPLHRQASRRCGTSASAAGGHDAEAGPRRSTGLTTGGGWIQQPDRSARDFLIGRWLAPSLQACDARFWRIAGGDGVPRSAPRQVCHCCGAYNRVAITFPPRREGAHPPGRTLRLLR